MPTESRIDVLEVKVQHLENSVANALNNVGSKLELVATKLDGLTGVHYIASTKVALLEASLESTGERVDELEDIVDRVTEQLITVRVSMAEKFGYSAVGGGAAAGLIALVKYLVEQMGS